MVVAIKSITIIIKSIQFYTGVYLQIKLIYFLNIPLPLLLLYRPTRIISTFVLSLKFDPDWGEATDIFQNYYSLHVHPPKASPNVCRSPGSESVGHDPLNGSSCQTVWRRQCRGLWALPSFGVYFKDRECESGSKSLNGASSAAAASVSPLIHNTSSGPSPWCLPPPGECERLLFQCDILLRMYPLICIYSWHWNETRPTREGCFVLC